MASPINIESEKAVRADLAAAHRLCDRERHVEGLWNHMSVVMSADPLRMLVTPNHRPWSVMRASDLLLVDADGHVFEGSGRPNGSTAIIHTPVHEARPDAICVIHVHPIHSTALFMQQDVRLETRASQAAASFDQDVAYFDIYDGPLYDRSEGERMAACLGHRSVLVLRNHGVLVVGRTIGEAFGRIYLFERACRLQLLAQLGGRPLNLIPRDVMRQMQEGDAEDAKRQAADGHDPAQAEWQGWLESLSADYSWTL